MGKGPDMLFLEAINRVVLQIRIRLWLEWRMLAYIPILFRRSVENYMETRGKLYVMAEEIWEKHFGKKGA